MQIQFTIEEAWKLYDILVLEAKASKQSILIGEDIEKRTGNKEPLKYWLKAYNTAEYLKDKIIQAIYKGEENDI